MKRILSILMAALLLVSAIPTAFAAEGEHDYSNGTQITLVGTQENQGAQWTVTVPAKMQPGQTGTVKAEGMWAADKFLQVAHPYSVTLAYGAQTMDVAVSGKPIMLIGNSAEQVSKEEDVTVADASRLFGTWEGILVYDVQLINGDFNEDGIIDAVDKTLIEEAALTQSSDLKYDITGDSLVNATDVARFQVLMNFNGIEVASE